MSAQNSDLVQDPLASWEQAAAVALESSDSESASGAEEVPPGLLPQVEQVKVCLQLLDQVWPRANSTGELKGTDDQSPTRPDGVVLAEADGPFQVPGFHIRGEISHGGMGVVYRAWHVRLNREVALKRLLPALDTDLERLKRVHIEAAAAARLKDAGVLPLFDLLEVDGNPVLVMPFIDGPDLGKVLTERRALKEGREVANPHPLAVADDQTYLEGILPLLDQLVDAVAAIHDYRIIHRDIKPTNVLLDRKGKIWLTDFGLAQLPDNPRITTPGTRMGTPGFISPEQWDGRGQLDIRADVFSLGATLYEALTLQFPYGTARPGSEVASPTAAHRHQPLVSKDLNAVILKALELDRDDRHGSVVELGKDWRRVRQGLPPEGRRLSKMRRLLRLTRRYPLQTASIGLIVGFVAILLGFLLPAKQAQPSADQPVLRNVLIATDPPGARVVLVPFNQYHELDPDKRIRPAGKQVTPLTLPRVPPGRYLVVAEVPGHGFHEVYRVFRF